MAENPPKEIFYDLIFFSVQNGDCYGIWIGCLFLWSLLIFREIFQLLMKICLCDLRGRWFENLMEYALIIYSGLLLLYPFEAVEEPDADIGTQSFTF